ncbi:hypothetical protein CEXT_248401 [Caerostris extrusa]|uniref:Uncharacterized protein n=1 Tax=Caerostris extrusa TaxID=172846 RepID=A0AAV4MD05_CAEEX|nr:hypothetical protein CEXT_248401 [Caerostris extrusa]
MATSYPKYSLANIRLSYYYHHLPLQCSVTNRNSSPIHEKVLPKAIKEDGLYHQPGNIMRHAEKFLANPGEGPPESNKRRRFISSTGGILCGTRKLVLLVIRSSDMPGPLYVPFLQSILVFTTAPRLKPGEGPPESNKRTSGLYHQPGNIMRHAEVGFCLSLDRDMPGPLYVPFLQSILVFTTARRLEARMS